VPLVDRLHYFIHRYIPPCHDPSVPIHTIVIGMAGSPAVCLPRIRQKWGITLAPPSGELPWP
jgi:hypothetical protein